MIDASCTHSYVVNSGVTEPNLFKFLHQIFTQCSGIIATVNERIYMVILHMERQSKE